ncbi:MAG TPA: hypothetical protein VME41_18055 [Stellaceae bacterium]|nr:hypothetical protein [Stellaceae bacterium]
MTKHPLLLTVTASALVLFGAAVATPRAAVAQTLTLSGSFSVTQSNATGNEPTIEPTSDSFSDLQLTTGTAYGPVDFLSVSPARSSGCRYCSNTASDTITVTFTGLDDGTSASTASSYSDTATYVADYNNDTDSVTWNDSGSELDPIVVDFTDGAVLDLTLGNASDWTIYPTITAEFVQGPSQSNNAVPGPATIAVFGSDVVGLGLLRRVRRTG